MSGRHVEASLRGRIGGTWAIQVVFDGERETTQAASISRSLSEVWHQDDALLEAAAWGMELPRLLQNVLDSGNPRNLGCAGEGRPGSLESLT